MQRNRQDNDTASYLRRSRFKQRDGEWFIATREGYELGPFETHAEAATCLDEFLNFTKDASAAKVQQFCKQHVA